MTGAGWVVESADIYYYLLRVKAKKGRKTLDKVRKPKQSSSVFKYLKIVPIWCHIIISKQQNKGIQIALKYLCSKLIIFFLHINRAYKLWRSIELS